MQLVEQHIISRNDPCYPVIDEAAFKSKNLYNAALYEIRQAFIHVSSARRRHDAGRAYTKTFYLLALR
jgi:hypothetical protein